MPKIALLERVVPVTQARRTVDRTPAQELEFNRLSLEVRELCPLPAVALRLIAMSEDNRFSAQDLAETIRADQALTLKVLRLANSPAFGLPRRITSIREAIVLLGFREVRTTALAACVLDRMVRDRLVQAGIDYDVFWRNSLVVGQISQILGEYEGVETDQAFTAGLVHNVGRLALGQHRPDWLSATAQEAHATGKPLDEIQEARLGFTDIELGENVARTWSFPPLLVEAIARHALPLSQLPDPRGLDSIVARARRYARSHGVDDGIDVVTQQLRPDSEWQIPRIARALDEVGGVEGIVERATHYIDGS